ncbi:MAG: homoserine dehydrogenase [Solirubrobacterales bacterium]
MGDDAQREAGPREVRIWVVGLGTVGRWVVRAVSENADALAARYGTFFSVVGVATGRGGFAGSADGLDVTEAIRIAEAGSGLAELSGANHWAEALDGMHDTDADVLVETAASPPEGEPGAAHMREAIRRGIPVVTSNKWPAARFGAELEALARDHGVAFRAESTVMSGTPLLGSLTEGLAGATPLRLRGVVNATANSILTDMALGASYEKALAAAQAAGLAEPDPSADVDGHDSEAKAMILSALVFGHGFELGEVDRRGISELTPAEEDALASGGCVREVTSLEFEGPGGTRAATARVRPEIIAADDPLAAINGTMNCVVVNADPLGEVRIAGPGAGPALAGQGVLSDLIRVACDLRSSGT